ncbi:hypothetical protein [Gordonia polyisoprenivorans]|uniref:hypothetical protein n=1 Tax=Gordonia polyisoprenivorans TaxID=84595 RepID=UPI001AD7602F|nr:hypothetical protein [Gordonia polyisoprenivorans]QTI68322.1 hypothetical protein J6U32_22935 [Gordonia polyisoprenivorans]
MRLRSELEILATLDATTIEAVCTDPSLVDRLIVACLDEAADSDTAAELAETCAETGIDDDDTDDDITVRDRGEWDHAAEVACFHRQEAAAWRATARVLARSQRSRDTPSSRPATIRNGRGVA